MKRILVLGAPASGKSQLSLILKEKLNLPLINLDQLYWSASWTPSNINSFKEKCLSLSQQSEWIMDGNFGATFDVRWPFADTIIYLDPSPWFSIIRQILRALNLIASPLRPKGCRDRFNQQLFWYTYKFRKAHGHLIETKVREEYSSVRFIKATSYKDILNQLELDR